MSDLIVLKKINPPNFWHMTLYFMYTSDLSEQHLGGTAMILYSLTTYDDTFSFYCHLTSITEHLACVE